MSLMVSFLMFTSCLAEEKTNFKDHSEFVRDIDKFDEQRARRECSECHARFIQRGAPWVPDIKILHNDKVYDFNYLKRKEGIIYYYDVETKISPICSNIGVLASCNLKSDNYLVAIRSYVHKHIKDNDEAVDLFGGKCRMYIAESRNRFANPSKSLCAKIKKEVDLAVKSLK